MGDFFWDSLRDTIVDQFFWSPGRESKEVDPIDFECNRLEEKERDSYYSRKPNFFLDQIQLDQCRARREPAPIAPPAPKKIDAELLKTLENTWRFLEKMGAGLQYYSHRSFEYWKAPTDPVGQIFKFMTLVAFGEPGDDNEIRKNKNGDIRGSFNFRGKNYEIETRDDLIIVNGQAWKFQGTTAKTEATSIKVESLSYDADKESLQLKIKGKVLFFEESVAKTFEGDQVAAILDALTRGSDAIATPEMKAKGIQLVPREAA